MYLSQINHHGTESDCRKNPPKSKSGTISGGAIAFAASIVGANADIMYPYPVAERAIIIQVRYIAQNADQLGNKPIMQYCIPRNKNGIANKKRQTSSAFGQKGDEKGIKTIVVFSSKHDFHAREGEYNEEKICEGKGAHS